MWVKICANTTLVDAQMAVDAGADAVGFIFAPSKRRLSGEKIAEIASALPEGVEKVGVFATDDPYEVEHGMAASGLTVAQLHRPYDAEFVRMLSAELGRNLKIIQTVAYELDRSDRNAADTTFAEAVEAAAADPAVWAVLIDAAKGGASGGLGVAFDWMHVGGLVRKAVRNRKDARVILAGGLRPETVGTAIAQFMPWGVDVASGVEAEVGTKSQEKVSAFITHAKAAETERPA